MAPSPREETVRRQGVAADPARSAWVSANAGTGKTRVLTQRVARLLLAGTAPERILCLTYTKAAAAEMTARLHALLGEWSTMPDPALQTALAALEARPVDVAELPRARRLFARAIETPGGLKIGTIHAFCQSLITRFPLEAALPSRFEVADDRLNAELKEDAFRRVLIESRREPVLSDALARLAQRFADRTLVQAVEAAADWLRRHPSGLTTGPAPDSHWRGGLERYFELAPGTTAARLKAAFVASQTARWPRLLELGHLLAAGAPKEQPVGRALIEALKEAPDDPERIFDRLAEAFLTQRRDPRKQLMNPTTAKIHPELDEFGRQVQIAYFEAFRRVPLPDIIDTTLDLLIAGRFQLLAFDRLKTARGLVDYEDLIQKVVQLLDKGEAAEWVLYKLDGGLDHILVDEAQDTSPDQWHILEALSTEFFAGLGARETSLRTIFAVGDEKQSIYSFQGAAPLEFMRSRSRLADRVAGAGGAWSDVALETSFRCAPAILDAVDAVFAPDDARRGLTGSGEAPHHAADRAGAPGRVELWPVFTTEKTDAPEPWDLPLDRITRRTGMARLAGHIAGTIAGWIATGEKLEARDRPIRPDDILILVQHRNTFFEEMIRALRREHLPVAGADRLSLRDEIAVMDLMAAGDFALFPDDDLTLATLLRSPLIGLGEAELEELAVNRQDGLWPALTARAADPRYTQAHALCRALRERADTAPVYEFYAELLELRGGRERLLKRLGPEALDPIEEFLSLAFSHDRQSTPSLQGFLHWLRRGPGTIKRDLEEAHGRIRLMTVHGAKGLEANIVILPDAHRRPKKSAEPTIHSLADPDGQGEDLPLWRAPGSQAGAALETIVSEQETLKAEEYRRLLYVAMTRARDRLYVAGTGRSDKVAEGSWYALVEAGLTSLGASEVPFAPAGGTGDGAGPALVYETGTQPLENDRETAMSTGMVAEPDPPPWIARPVTAETPRQLRAPSALLGAGEPPVLSPLAGDSEARFRRGTAIHRLLELIADAPIEDRPARTAAWLARPEAGFSDAEQAEIAATTLATLADRDLAAFFGPDSRAEVALAGEVPEWGASGWLNGRVDRLVVTPTRVIVVDIKTNRPAPARIEDVAPVYLVQMAGYRSLLERIYPGRKISCVLLWTDGPKAMTLPSALIDRVFDDIAREARQSAQS